MTTTDRPPPVPFCPPPWSLRCEQYWLFSWLPSGALHKGCYGRFEEPASDHGEPRGGLVVIMIVRYTDTPCGPYDELILIPGKFARPVDNTYRRSVSVCYVSKENTTFNGRLNWNVPKHLARFEFSYPTVSATSPPPKALAVAVYPPKSESTMPFFSIALQPWRVLPAIPYASAYSPIDVTLLQPPLSSLPEEAMATSGMSEARTKEILIATDRWVKAAVPVKSSKIKMMSVESQKLELGPLEAKEAQKWWPQGLTPFRVGCWLENAELVCQTEEVWDA